MNAFLRTGILCVWALLLTPKIHAQELPTELQAQIDRMIRSELSQRAFPGAIFLTGGKAGIRYARSYGRLSYSDTTSVGDSTLYDMASCSKVLGTTFVLMRLYDQNLFSLEQRVEDFLPQFASTPVGTLSFEELLTHTSGLRPIVFYPLVVKPPRGERLFAAQASERYPYPVEDHLYRVRTATLDTALLSREPLPGYRRGGETLYINPAIDTLIARRILSSYRPSLRGTYQYNDTNFYLLGLLAEQLSGRPLSELVQELYAELACHDTGYRPCEWTVAERIAPTETDYLLQRGALRGYAHDETAALKGGVSGNAGLFSTGRDVARFCQMILDSGRYNGRKIIAPQTVLRFCSSPYAARGIYHALGFDKRNPMTLLGENAGVGHTGFTGTFFWINPQRDLFMVLLTNRVHPTRRNNRLSTSQLRSNLWRLLETASR